MVLIVMLMCSEMGEIIMPSGMERLREEGGWRNEEEEQSDRGGREPVGVF